MKDCPTCKGTGKVPDKKPAPTPKAPHEKLPPYVRKEIYRLEQVLPFVVFQTAKFKDKKPDWYHDYDGDKIDMSSGRYQLYATKGTKCVGCGIVGTYFAKERSRKGPSQDRWHFNLYGLDANGKEVMLTKDHIFPKWAGGFDRVVNFQPMCADCNRRKGGELHMTLEEAVERGLANEVTEELKLLIEKRLLTHSS